MKLSDIVDRINGNVDRFNTDLEYYIGGEHMDSNELLITDRGLLKENLGKLGFKFHFAFQERDVIFMARNPHLRKAGMVMFSGLCSDASYILRSKDENVITQEYLAIQLQSDHFWDYCERTKVGSVNFANNWTSIANYEFDLPSIDEQKEISQKVWAAYRLKESYKKLLAATDEMVKSQFIEMMGDLPKNGTLSDYCEMKAGKSIKSDSINSQYNDGLYPCYGGNGLRGYVETYSHDGVYNIIGRQGALCGNITLTKGKFYATEHAIVVRPKTPINEYWLYFALAQMNLNQYARGVAQPGLAVKQLEKLPFGIPSKGKQEKFAAVYQQADKSKFVGFKSQFIEMFGNPLSSIQKNELKKLGDCCQINPRRPSVSISDSDLVSFVPMPAVNEDGYIDGATNEEYGKVKKGFTYFENNDVLFAKITPCMENGKGAIAEALTNGIGMGSTEFHVLRPIDGKSNPYWLLTLTRMPIFREYAAKNMSGTGGQRRVGAAFLENFMIGLPSISEQETFETIYRQADKSKLTGHCLICVLNKGISKLIN